MDDLRSQFPVLARLSYLNAGTNGPIPRASIAAAEAQLREQADQGRGGGPFFHERVMPLAEALRARAAALMGADPTEVALTGSTTDGVNVVLSALELGPGDEVLTSDEEHPGVFVPLASGKLRRGYDVRVVPLDRLAEEVRPETRLVACSHVSWVTGRVVDAAAIAATGVQVLLDGAQGLGAVPVDVKELGCDFYAAPAQKWLCGPNGIGFLYVREPLAAELVPPWPGFGSLASPEAAATMAAGADRATLERGFHEQARRLDLGFPAPEQAAWALAALDVLEAPGFGSVLDRAARLASALADGLAQRGIEVVPRGPSTLVSWRAEDAERESERLLAEDVVVRHLPGRDYVRASVGGWTCEQEIDRLVSLAAGWATSAS